MFRLIVPSCLALVVACGDNFDAGPPVLEDFALSTAEDTPLAVTIPAAAIEAEAVGFTLVTPPAHGELSGEGPTWLYTPDPDYAGDDSLTIRADNRHGSASATVLITVTPVNDPPAATADSYAAVFETPLTIEHAALTANDTDIEGGPLTVIGVEAAADGHGVPALGGSDVVFTPEPGFEGTAAFSYTISDGELSAEATVTVTVGPNRAPVALDDAAATDEDTPLVIEAAALLANDGDPDLQTLVISSVGNPSDGAVSQSGTQIIFTPAPDFVGEAAFDYTITDQILTDVGTVTVAVGSVNDAPVVTVSPGTATYVENAPALALDAAIGLADVDGAALVGAAIQIATGCSGGQDELALASPPAGIAVGAFDAESCTLALTGAASLADYEAALRQVTYRNTSEAPAVAARVVRFTVDDGQAASSTGAADRDLLVTAVDDAPVAVDDVATVAEDSAATAIAVLANDTDVDEGPMSIGDVTQPAGGAVAVVAGTLSYTPAPDYCNSGLAADTFTYSLEPGGGAATVSVTVPCSNDAPVAADDAATTDEDTTLVIADATLLANDADADQEALAITSVGNASNGTVSHVGAQVNFVPAPDFNGAASFEYTVSDQTATDTGTVVVTVQSVNDAPVVTATAGAVAYAEDAAPVAVDAGLTVSDVDHAVLASATVQLTTGCASDQDVLALASPPAGITVSGYDAPTCTLSLTGAASPASYQAGLRQVTYDNTSEAPSTAGRVVRFAVDDGDPTSSTGAATRALVVTADDDPPVAVNDARTIAEDAGPTSIAVLDNDTDVDGGPITITSVTQPASGTVVVVGGTSLTYVPDLDHCNSPPGTTPDQLTYQLAPGGSTAVVSVTVTCVADGPIAVDDTADTDEDTTLVIDDATLLANDTDADQETLVITSVGNATNGAVSHAGAQVTFTPDPDFTGVAGFEYTVSDQTLTDVAAVVVTVQSVNDSPVVTASAGSAAYVENAAPVALDPALGLADADSAELASAAVQITSGCVSGEDVLALDSPPPGIAVAAYDAPSCTLSLSGAASVASYQAGLRLVTYHDTSQAPATATRVVRFTVDDGATSGGSGSATRDLAVTAVDDDPVAVNDAATVAEDAAATAIAVLANDTDVDGGAMTISSVTQPTSGTVAIVGGTSLTYAPAADYCNAPPGTAPDVFTYDLAPGGGTGVVSVTVTCDDDAPIAVDDVASVAGDSGANTIDVLANDTDIDGGPMTVQAVTQPTHGLAAVGSSGSSVTYTPAAGYCNEAPNAGLDAFTYTLGGGSSATITVDVSCVCGLNLPTDFVVASN